jgi:hypothetical protein
VSEEKKGHGKRRSESMCREGEKGNGESASERVRIRMDKEEESWCERESEVGKGRKVSKYEK